LIYRQRMNEHPQSLLCCSAPCPFVTQEKNAMIEQILLSCNDSSSFTSKLCTYHLHRDDKQKKTRWKKSRKKN
jgi:hypothetical protein